MKIVLFESQLKNLIESYGDNFGFIEPNFDERELKYDILASIDVFSLVRKKNSKETYVVYIDDVPYDYYQGYFNYVNDDEDEDSDTFWENAHREFGDDTYLNNDGISLFTEDLVLNSDVTTSINDLYGDIYALLITPENKKQVYDEFEDLIQAYLDPSKDETSKSENH